MKQLVGLALAAAWMGSSAVWAQAPAPPPPPAVPAAPVPPAPPATPARNHGNQVQGRVTAMDMTKRTVTVTPRRSPTATTLTLAPDVKILVTKAATIGDIKTGDIIEAYGTVTPGVTTVAADRIAVVPATTRHGRPRPNAGYFRNRVQGTVANTTPSLTMTTAGGVTVTVTTTAETPVTKVSAGALSDLTVGANVQARTTGDAAAPTATEVRIMPANARRGGGRKAKAAETVPAPAATETPVK